MENHFIYYLSKALTASLVAYCIGGLFLTNYYYIHIYLLIALTLAIKKVMVEEEVLPEFPGTKQESLKQIREDRNGRTIQTA